jgi:hypothetical protein
VRQRARRSTPTVLSLVAAWALLLSVTNGAPPVGALEEPGATYHLSCTGNDDADGRTPGTAWRSLGRLDRTEPAPGERVVFERGCRWHGPLRIPWSGTSDAPIVVGAYGEGPQPILENAPTGVAIEGSHLIIEELHTRTDPPGVDALCDDQPAGRSIGFRLMAGSSFVTIARSTASELFAGISIGRGSHHNRIVGNRLVDNHMKSDDPASDAGAIGIDVLGDDNEIAFNEISGSTACSRFFSGVDGSAISVFGGRRNTIHHNVSRDNHNFLEVGDRRTSDTVVAYNTDASDLHDSTFLVVHGVARYGPVTRTFVFNNTAFLAGGAGVGLQCVGTCDRSTLSFRDNIVWAEDRVGHSSAPFDEDGNLYWRSDGHPEIFFELGPRSRVVDPGLVDPWAGDLRLGERSPAADAASWSAWLRGLWSDADGRPVPFGDAPDIGAYERP